MRPPRSSFISNFEFVYRVKLGPSRANMAAHSLSNAATPTGSSARGWTTDGNSCSPYPFRRPNLCPCFQTPVKKAKETSSLDYRQVGRNKEG